MNTDLGNALNEKEKASYKRFYNSISAEDVLLISEVLNIPPADMKAEFYLLSVIDDIVNLKLSQEKSDELLKLLNIDPEVEIINRENDKEIRKLIEKNGMQWHSAKRYWESAKSYKMKKWILDLITAPAVL